MSLQDDILKALDSLVTLTITTTVTGGGETERKSMVTEIKLLTGDISTDIPKEFVDGGPYASLRAFHQAREEQGSAIITSNVEALLSLLGLAASGEQPTRDGVVATLTEQLSQLGQDLITRQVNLIIASGGMSAEPMPADPVVAMRQIYRWYYDRLLGQPGSEQDQLISALDAAGLATAFGELADGLRNESRDARRALAGLETATVSPASDRLVLRMRATARDLGTIATHAAAGVALTPSETAVLRKAWEIGTDEVVLQTTIALDGDVVLRADSRYCTETQRALFDLHDQSCATAMRTWKDVVGAAIDLVTGLFKKASG